MYDLFVQTRPDSGVKRTEIGHYIKELKQKEIYHIKLKTIQH